MGIAALAVSAGGAVTAANPALIGASATTSTSTRPAPSAVRPASPAPACSTAPGRGQPRLPRDALADAADQELVAQAEKQAKERNAALAKFAKQAEQQAAKIALNQWVLPVDGLPPDRRFGDYGLWSSYHTGLDFAAPSGTPIHAVANGVVTSAATTAPTATRPSSRSRTAPSCGTATRTSSPSPSATSSAPAT